MDAMNHGMKGRQGMMHEHDGKTSREHRVVFWGCLLLTSGLLLVPSRMSGGDAWCMPIVVFTACLWMVVLVGLPALRRVCSRWLANRRGGSSVEPHALPLPAGR